MIIEVKSQNYLTVVEQMEPKVDGTHSYNFM